MCKKKFIKFLVGVTNLPGSGFRFLAGSGSGFNESGSETLLEGVRNDIKWTEHLISKKYRSLPSFDAGVEKTVTNWAPQDIFGSTSCGSTYNTDLKIVIV